MSAEAARFAGIGDEAGKPIAEQISALRALGWRHLELRTVDGLPLAELDRAGARAVEAAVHRAGFSVVCLDSRIGSWARPATAPFADDLAELDTLSQWCARLGTRYVRIMSYPADGLGESEWRHRVLDRVSRLTERAERAGIVLLHENCSGWAGASAERAVRLLDTVDSPALRLLFDTGNGIAHGYHAYDLLAEVAGLVEHVHVKDAVPTQDGPRYTLPGEGLSRVADCLRLLQANGYRGLFSLEPHLSVLPHEGRRDEDAATDRFIAAGRRLERLVSEDVAEVLDRRAGSAAW
ncbi:sugar phosphate isomerase/epimerase family protein [Amycolatopsis nigrescens]|uniref:sugar phosphate isomerase/epimerase family protein n=1 Tax=Amycolatopsis nigrescens TaxID=381445 RepID=UPI00035E501E|nr:sugar phosphate isomerase/epimerase family protein [Amycolatopsis nigrescens]